MKRIAWQDEARMTSEDVPPMPATEAEWRVHWAFYKLTVAQRNAAWRELDKSDVLASVRESGPAPVTLPTTKEQP